MVVREQRNDVVAHQGLVGRNDVVRQSGTMSWNQTPDGAPLKNLNKIRPGKSPAFLLSHPQRGNEWSTAMLDDVRLYPIHAFHELPRENV